MIYIQLTETDKRIIFACLIALILVFVIISLIGNIIIKISKSMGQKLDSQVSDVLTNYVIRDKRSFIRYASKKNVRTFYKQSWIPILMVIAAMIVWSVAGITKHNPFKEFSSLLFVWDFKDPDSYTYVFGLKVLAKWPPLKAVEDGFKAGPHFNKADWLGYIVVPLLVIGGLWFMISTQAFVCRTIRMNHIANKNINANLDNFNQAQSISNQPITQQALDEAKNNQN